MGTKTIFQKQLAKCLFIVNQNNDKNSLELCENKGTCLISFMLKTKPKNVYGLIVIIYLIFGYFIAYQNAKK